MPIKKVDVFVAFLMYSPTLVLLPQALMYLCIAVIGFFYFLVNLNKGLFYNKDLIFLLFVFLSILVYYIGGPVYSEINSRSTNDFVPYTVFLLTTVFFARNLSIGVLTAVLCLVSLEVFVGIYEYLSGKPYLVDPRIYGETEFGETDLFYYNRVYGLSPSVSVFAYKIFIGILLLHYIPIKKYKPLVFSLMLIGLVVSFNRTAIVASIFFLALFYARSFISLKLKYRLLVLSVLAIITFLFIKNLESIYFQFFRGRGEDLSGRDVIFPYFVSFINENILLGNNVHKMWGAYGGKVFHAHNSYLQTIANLGVLLSGTLLVYVAGFFNRRNMVFLLPILVYSSFQYGILWGVSFLDIIFFYFLFIGNGTKIEKRTDSIDADQNYQGG